MCFEYKMTWREKNNRGKRTKKAKKTANLLLRVIELQIRRDKQRIKELRVLLRRLSRC